MLMTLAGINLFLAALFAVVAFEDREAPSLAWAMAAVVPFAASVALFIQ